MMNPAERHADEALANAMAHVAIDLVRDALDTYDRGEIPVGVVLALISQAAGYGTRASLTGRDFLSASKADRW